MAACLDVHRVDQVIRDAVQYVTEETTRVAQLEAALAELATRALAEDRTRSKEILPDLDSMDKVMCYESRIDPTSPRPSDIP
jgi:hypothetical protein